MSKNKSPMTPKAAARIQGHADRHGTNQGFKARAQAAAATNASAAPEAVGTATTGKAASTSNG